MPELELHILHCVIANLRHEPLCNIQFIGIDVICVLDELSIHSKLYRTRYLLKQGMPGRSAYPSEVFYSHSSILERSCKLSHKYTAGSVTALPIIKTFNNNITEYICTNLISITDGQLIFDKLNYLSGIKPSIHHGLSVSRIGSRCQPLSLNICKTIQYDKFHYIQAHLDIYSYELALLCSMHPRLVNQLIYRNVLYILYPYKLLMSSMLLSTYHPIKIQALAVHYSV